jgi:hypothetical protein
MNHSVSWSVGNWQKAGDRRFAGDLVGMGRFDAGEAAHGEIVPGDGVGNSRTSLSRRKILPIAAHWHKVN